MLLDLQDDHNDDDAADVTMYHRKSRWFLGATIFKKTPINFALLNLAILNNIWRSKRKRGWWENFTAEFNKPTKWIVKLSQFLSK